VSRCQILKLYDFRSSSSVNKWHHFQASTEKSKKLENLGTVMTLYSRRTFSKESFQWTKCVVKYLYDTYAHLSLNMLAFLVEVKLFIFICDIDLWGISIRVRAMWNSVVQHIQREFHSIFVTASNNEYNDLHWVQ